MSLLSSHNALKVHVRMDIRFLFDESHPALYLREAGLVWADADGVEGRVVLALAGAEVALATGGFPPK
jgi:hypothetical protein